MGKGAFLDFDGAWDEGSITYDRKVLGIKNMNGYNLRAELSYQETKTISKDPVSPPKSPEVLIKEFYTYILGEKEMTEDVLDTFLSKDMKLSLWELDYEGQYAYWRFRTAADDGNGEPVGPDGIKQVSHDGNSWYTVSYIDMGFEGRTKVKVVNGKIVGLKQDESWGEEPNP